MAANDVELPAELLKLVKKRDSYKRSMDSIKTFINKYDPTTKSFNQLQTRLDSLVQYMSKYESYQDEIEDHEAATVDLLNHRANTNEFFCSLKAEILDLMERHTKA